MIHGFFDRLSGNRPHVRAELRIDALSVGWTSIRLLIDTGATTSAVHADTAFSTLRIDRAQLVADSWPVSEQTQLGGVGGLLHYRRLPATWRFEHDNGEALQINAHVHLGEYRDPPVDEGADATNGLPSLLGWDVLERFQLTLDRPDNLVTLAPRPPSGT